MEDKNNILLEEKIQEYKLEEKECTKRSNRLCLLIMISIILSGIVFSLIPQTWSLPVTLILTVIPSVTGFTVALVKALKLEFRLDAKKKEVADLKRKIQSQLLKEKTRKLSLEHKKTLNEIMKDKEFSSYLVGVLEAKQSDFEVFNNIKEIITEELELYGCEDGTVYLDSETSEKELSEDSGVVYKKGSKK